MKRIWAVSVLLLFGCKGNVNDDSVSTVLMQIASASSGGQAGNGSSSDSDVSADGRFVVFRSSSTNLDPRDSNTISDIYVRDLETGLTQLVSVNAAGTAGGNNFSDNPRISPDGRFVVFLSNSTNLTAFTDTNGSGGDVFCRDLEAGVTIPVSLNPAETATHEFSSFQVADVTSDATHVFVAYEQFTNAAANQIIPGVNGSNVYVRRIPIATFTTLTTTDVFLISDDLAAGVAGANGSHDSPVIGQDTTNVYVAWQSSSTELHALDTNSTTDVFWRSMDKTTGAVGPTTLVSINDAGTGGGGDGIGGFEQSDTPAISEDGRWVAFQSDASDLIPIGVDFNGSQDIYVRGDLISGPEATTRVSVDSAGNQVASDSSNPEVSSDGTFIAFDSTDPNLVSGDANGFADVFRHNRITGVTERASLTLFGGEPNASCQECAISGDGSVVTFHSGASNIIPGSVFDQQVFVRGF